MSIQPALPRKQCIAGVGISVTSYGGVTALCRSWIEHHRSRLEAGDSSGAAQPGRYICVTSVHGIIAGSQDRTVQDALNRADVATPDGMPVVWAMRSFGCKDQRRVYGPDLMAALCKQAASCQHRVFLYGGRQESLPVLRQRLLQSFPGLQIVGAYSPPFRPLTSEEDAESIRRITESGTELLFVGLSTPKQDRWMADHVSRLPGVVMVGVGAAFDFHAGRVRQAPPWMQQRGLEWLYRLYREPRRLWKRYITIVPLFLPLWAMQKAGLLKYPSHPSQ